MTQNTHRTCEFPGCDRPHQSRGLCNAHVYQRNHGLPLAPIGTYLGRTRNAGPRTALDNGTTPTELSPQWRAYAAVKKYRGRRVAADRDCAHAPACPNPAAPGSRWCDRHAAWEAAQRAWNAKRPAAV